ncbi:hypothetical protein J421_2841 [Gemmatirosa kalamazoonensis]|uniref:Uncharacterized protein n=1 Tax=Gemmatirosa kalamazoonensis TaxID=861299 RepID=W0RLR4_9BACT|nr:hypothetical protein [Gemmatirosa kalamazoonensis]AHG90378.1 hypothetical protein J421_2841 [Gemmatirosa kalamazoonensis]
MRRLVLGALLVVGARSALAQSRVTLAAPLPAGARVRVTQSDSGSRFRNGIQARVVAMRGDTLVVAVDRAETVAVPLTRDTRVELFRGRRRRPLRGFLMGAGTCAAIGAAVGAIMPDDPPGEFTIGRGDRAAILGGALGIVGGVIGLIAGAAGDDVWQPVAVPVDGR